MEWLTVRLTKNDARGLMGDLVDVPSGLGCNMIRSGTAEPAGAKRLPTSTPRQPTPYGERR